MYLDKCVNFSETPIKVNKRKYIYLYETVNKCNDDIYIGVRTFRGKYVDRDNYIGNGCCILSDGRLCKRYGSETDFRKALSKYGYLNFEKKIICFFLNIEDALKSEANIVDKEFTDRNDVLNMTLGGGKPPTASGELNSNYGHYWSDEMKFNLSRTRREGGKSKGVNNAKAKAAYLYDLWEDTEHPLSYLRELDHIKRSSYRKISQFRYLISEVKLNNEEEINKYIITECAEKYQKTYKILQLVKQGLTIKEIVDRGFLKAHVARLNKRYYESN